MKKTRSYTEIEGMRGILAVIIVLYHFGLESLVSQVSSGLISESYWGNAVDYFFIISGFVLGVSQSKNPKTWFQFTKSRLFRLLPSYIFLIIVFSPWYIDHWINNIPDILLSIFGLAYPFGYTQWNGASWSMSVELYIPIIVAPLLIPILQLKNIKILVFLSSLIATSFMAISDPSTELPLGFVRGFFGILLGYTLYGIVKEYPNLAILPFGQHSTLIFFSSYLVLTLLSDIFNPVGFIIPTLTVLSILSSEGSKSILSSKLLIWLGSLTYTIYLIHMPLQKSVVDVLGNDMVDGNIFIKAFNKH